MKVKNEYQVTWERYRSWCAESMFQGIQLAFRVMWCVLAVGFLVLSIVAGEWIYGLMMVYCIYQAFVSKLVQGKAQYKKQTDYYKKDSWMRRMILDEEKIGLSEGRLFLTYEYKHLKKIRHKGNKIWLHFQDGTVLRMYKDAFVEGSWEECRQLVEKKVLKYE